MIDEQDGGEIDGVCVTRCRRCPSLVASRSQIVNGVGPVNAELVIVGEAPGADEDAAGEPFVGRSGQLLTDYLTRAGIERKRVRITNCVRCRPPDNRDPQSGELASCRGWLDAELAQVDPTIVVAAGKVPASHLLGRDVAVTAEAGRIERVALGGRIRPVVICVHPAAVLYDRSQATRLDRALAIAAAEIGVTADGDGQARLSEY